MQGQTSKNNTFLKLMCCAFFVRHYRFHIFCEYKWSWVLGNSSGVNPKTFLKHWSGLSVMLFSRNKLFLIITTRPDIYYLVIFVFHLYKEIKWTRCLKKECWRPYWQWRRPLQWQLPALIFRLPVKLFRHPVHRHLLAAAGLPISAR